MVGQLPDDKMLVDIGAQTAAKYREIIMGAQTVFVNGPMGISKSKKPSSAPRRSGRRWRTPRAIPWSAAVTA